MNVTEAHQEKHLDGAETIWSTAVYALIRQLVEGLDDLIAGDDYADGIVAAAVCNLVEEASPRNSPALERKTQGVGLCNLEAVREREVRIAVMNTITPEAAPHYALGQTIGQFSRRYGVSLRTIRFYEMAGLLNPIRIGTNRYFNP